MKSFHKYVENCVKAVSYTHLDVYKRQVHRGPSSSGEFIDEGAAIGFRRLSIIDLEGGDQPIFNEDKSKLITFNAVSYTHLKNFLQKSVPMPWRMNLKVLNDILKNQLFLFQLLPF